MLSKADVNLAAVNYHFGSKNAPHPGGMFAIVFLPFAKIIDQELDKRMVDGKLVVGVEELLIIITSSIVRIPAKAETASRSYAPLVQPHSSHKGTCKFLESEHRNSFWAVYEGVQTTLHRELTNVDRFWRIQLMMGAMAFTSTASRLVRYSRQ